MKKSYHLTEKLWLYPGKAGWFFISIPTEITREIEYYFSEQKRGWGSLPVSVTVGTSIWQTSIFHDKKSETYLLPVKAAIRQKEGLEENQQVTFQLDLGS